MAAKRKHKTLRGSLSRARRHARTALDDAARDGIFAPAELEPLHASLADIELCQRPDRLSLEALAATCDAAERFHDDLVARIRSPSADISSGNIPAKARVQPVPQLHTKKNSVQTLVAADLLSDPPSETPETSAAPPGPERGNSSSGETSYRLEDLKAPAGEELLEALSPRIARYLPADREPSMTDFVEAASRARRDLKISPTLWGAACTRMSPGGASLALAHVAAKWDAGKIEKTPGAYFNGVFESALKGDLNLAASLWGMVKNAPEEPAGSPYMPASPAGPSTALEGNDRRSGRAPHSSALVITRPASPLPSLFPDDPPPGSSRAIAGLVVMRRFCSHMPDPERADMMQVWRDLVRRRSRWPYLRRSRTTLLRALRDERKRKPLRSAPEPMTMLRSFKPLVRQSPPLHPPNSEGHAGLERQIEEQRP